MQGGLTKFFTSIILAAVIVGQVFGVYAVIKPEPVFAQLSASQVGNIFPPDLFSRAAIAETTSVPTVKRFDWQDFLKDVFKQIMLGVAYSMAQNFTQRFVGKLIEKYKIRNFLYYDQILANYYLTNFIRDKIGDPNLREIYVLLESEFVLGQPNGTTPGSSGIDRRNALVPRIQRAIENLYKQETGIDPNIVGNPPPNMDLRTYLEHSQAFYFNNVGNTDVQLRAQFGSFRSKATTASQLEVIIGNGLKAGRWIGGRCSLSINKTDGDSNGVNTPAACTAKGGVWMESELDKARSYIDNPAILVDKYIAGTVARVINTNFDPNNFWFVIGNSLGQFLYSHFDLDKAKGVLNEDPRGYTPDNGASGSFGQAPDNKDIDGDGVTDAYDENHDGVIDFCAFGGTPPNNCNPSSGLNPTDPGSGNGPPDALTRHPSKVDVINRIKNELTIMGISLEGPCGAFEITKRVAWELRSEGAGLLASYRPDVPACGDYAADIIVYADGYNYDILGNEGVATGNVPQWVPRAIEDAQYIKPAFNPNPVCPVAHPARPLTIVLSDIVNMASSWKFNVDKVGQSNFNEDLAKSLGNQLGDVKDDVRQFENKANDVQDELERWHGTGSFGHLLLDDTEHFFTTSERELLNAAKTQLLTKAYNLLIEVGATCQ